MAHLVRQSITCYVDRDGHRVPKGTRGAKKVREKSAKWYGAGLPGQGKKRFPLATDKSVAKKMLTDLVEKFERGIAHLPDREEAGLALEPLVEEFEESVRRKSGEKHTLYVVGNVRKVLAGCALRTLSHLRTPGLAAKVETYVWSLTTGDDAVSPTTAAYAGKHTRGFTRWLWRKRKLLDSDPLAGVDLPSQVTGNPRRALSPAEVAALISAAESSARTFRNLAGPDRAVLYLVAVATGYRAGELARLTPADFDLEADVPVARLAGRQTKNKKPAEQPLPPVVAARLREYLRARPADQPVWPGTWAERSADMIRADLRAADVPAVVGDEAALFHSLRHTYTSMLARSAPVKVTQDLVRHSSAALTIGRYAHASLEEKAEAVACLPLPGVSVAAGPFAGLTRAELESTAEALLLSLLLLTPPLTPNRETAGDSEEPHGTGGGRSGKSRRRMTA
jgi:integrase